MHLHLCFDGIEAPLSLHALDNLVHHEGEALPVLHQDADLTVIEDTLAKSRIWNDDLAIAILVTALLWIRLNLSRRLEFVSPPSAAYVKNYFLTPPTRGPPGFSLA